MRRAAHVLLAFLSLGVAGYAIVAYGFLPLGVTVHPEQRASFEGNRAIVYVHIFASAVALLAGPFQFSRRLRAARPSLHRWMGRAYLGLGVLAGGLAGLFMAVHAHGGLASQLGFGGLAVGWLYTGARAYAAIRARDVESHRQWMVRNFALTFAAVTLRLWLPAAMMSGARFEIAYPAVAWLCWVPNLLVAETLFNRARAR